MLCQYKDLLGEVGKGVHSYRVFNIAIFDVLLTILGAYIIQKFLLPTVKFIYVLGGFFILGIFLHHIFCVKTTVDKIIFQS